MRLHLNLFFLLLPLLTHSQDSFSPQPVFGPGSADYAHDSVIFMDFAQEEDGYWLFEPAAPAVEVAPVVVFVHGYSAYNPLVYGKWIRHLVRKGNIVIFPRYQKNIFSPAPSEFISNTITGINDALNELCTDGHTLPDITSFTMVGHSFGGAIIANLMAGLDTFDIPKPKGVFLVSPGTGPFTSFQLEDYQSIPGDLKMLVMVSDGDRTVGDEFGLKVFNTAVFTEERNLIRQHADRYSRPFIDDSHNECYAVDEAFDSGIHGHSYRRSRMSTYDPVDYNGYWKLFDGMLDCIREGQNCHYAFGDTPQQRNLGKWADGTPIRPLEITVPSDRSLAK